MARCALLLLTLGMAAAARGEDWQAPESIGAAAEALARASLAGRSGVKISAYGIDSRVKLPRCGEPLEAEAPRGFVADQGTVTVSCPGPSAWRLFVPVRVSFLVTTLVARHGLARGQVLTAADLAVEERDSHGLPAAYLTQLEQAVGLKLRRGVAAGAVLNPAVLEQPRLVRRGDLVTLVAEGRGIVVKSEGTALEDALLDGRVRVRTRSGRVVEGVVTAANYVRVGAN